MLKIKSHLYKNNVGYFNNITFSSIMGILFIFLFFIIDNNMIITVQSSLENPQTITNSNQSNPISNSTTTIQWKPVLIKAVGISLEYPSNWQGSTFTHDSFVAYPKYEQYENEIYPVGTEFKFEDYGKTPFKNLDVLTRMKAVSAIEFSFADDADYQLIESPNMDKYNIDGEKVGAFSYRQIYSDFILNVEEIVLIRDGKFFNFKFSYKEGAFDEENITKLKDHMFNSIRWMEKEKV